MAEKKKGAPEGARAPSKGRQAETTQVTPKLAKAQERRAPAPLTEESPAFLFTHRAEAWHVMRGKLVPRLGKLKIAPGINGVTQDMKTEELDPRTAITTLQENGVVVIPWDVDGEGTSYLASPKDRPGTIISRFERVYAGSRQIDSDEVAYAAWCESLVERGLIDPCPTYVLDRLQAQKVKEIEAAERQGEKLYMQRLIGDLDVIERELAKREPVAAETVTPNVPLDPVKGRGKGKAAEKADESEGAAE